MTERNAWAEGVCVLFRLEECVNYYYVNVFIMVSRNVYSLDSRNVILVWAGSQHSFSCSFGIFRLII